MGFVLLVGTFSVAIRDSRAREYIRGSCKLSSGVQRKA